MEARRDRDQADFFRLTADGNDEAVPLDINGRFRSTVLARSWLDPNRLWQDPLPEPIELFTVIAPDILDRLSWQRSPRPIGDGR